MGPLRQAGCLVLLIILCHLLGNIAGHVCAPNDIQRAKWFPHAADPDQVLLSKLAGLTANCTLAGCDSRQCAQMPRAFSAMPALKKNRFDWITQAITAIRETVKALERVDLRAKWAKEITDAQTGTYVPRPSFQLVLRNFAQFLQVSWKPLLLWSWVPLSTPNLPAKETFLQYPDLAQACPMFVENAVLNTISQCGRTAQMVFHLFMKDATLSFSKDAQNAPLVTLRQWTTGDGLKTRKVWLVRLKEKQGNDGHAFVVERYFVPALHNDAGGSAQVVSEVGPTFQIYQAWVGQVTLSSALGDDSIVGAPLTLPAWQSFLDKLEANIHTGALFLPEANIWQSGLHFEIDNIQLIRELTSKDATETSTSAWSQTIENFDRDSLTMLGWLYKANNVCTNKGEWLPYFVSKADPQPVQQQPAPPVQLGGSKTGQSSNLNFLQLQRHLKRARRAPNKL